MRCPEFWPGLALKSQEISEDAAADPYLPSVDISAFRMVCSAA